MPVRLASRRSSATAVRFVLTVSLTFVASTADGRQPRPSDVRRPQNVVSNENRSCSFATKESFSTKVPPGEDLPTVDAIKLVIDRSSGEVSD
jgi:hypothetical protein